MTYVISDIHGCYDKYIQILELIDFKDSDTLFILGDVIDRGAEPIKILLDMMPRPNVFPILGNHEEVAIDFLSKLLVEITDENHAEHIDGDFLMGLPLWFADGGVTTLDGFKKLPNEERAWVYEYLQEFSLYEIVTVNDKKFILTHSGLPEGADLKKLESENEYKSFDFALATTEYSMQYFDDGVFLVTGHVPTFHIDPAYKGKIYRANNNIAIDTGAVFGEPLACLCLDTDEEFYA